MSAEHVEGETGWREYKREKKNNIGEGVEDAIFRLQNLYEIQVSKYWIGKKNYVAYGVWKLQAK